MAAVRVPAAAAESGAGSMSGISVGDRGASAGGTKAREGAPAPPPPATCGASGSGAGVPGDGFEPGGGTNSRGCGRGSAPAFGRSTRADVAPAAGASGTEGAGAAARRVSRGGTNVFGFG